MRFPPFLRDTGYVSRQETESSLAIVSQSLKKARGEPKNGPLEVEEKSDSANEKYPLINIPDDMLTPDQIKEKKRQLFIKTTSDGRQRAKQKRSELELERERRNIEDEEKRNPQLYVEQLHIKCKELSEKVEQRKRLKTSGNHSNGNNGSGGVGRGERLNAAQRERMRLLTIAAFDRGKGEDNFGAKDEDWQLYKLMSKDNDDDNEGEDENEVELTRIAAKLQDVDPAFVPKPELGPLQPASASEVTRVRPLTKVVGFQILLGVERFRFPEILFHPNLVGIDHPGLDDMTGVSIRRLPDKNEDLENRLTSSILLTGGSGWRPRSA